MQIERRTFLKYVGYAAWGLLSAACASEAPARPTASPTKAPAIIPTIVSEITVSSAGNHWFDNQLPANDPLLKNIQFYFDPRYGGGSLAMEICFQPASVGEYRIIARQESLNGPGPGFVFNRPFDISGQACVLRYPVIEVEPDEVDWVGIGTRRPDDPYDSTYKVRAYRTTRIGSSQNLGVVVLGSQELNPESIKPRDINAPKDYFKR